GLRVGEDFFLAFSPERVDPGNPKWNTHNTPKVVGGITAACRRVAMAIYEPAIERLVAVSSTEAAELVKILENTFRSVNIGLVNEMAIVCDKLGVVGERPALDVIRLLQRRGAAVSYHDPHVRKLKDEAIDLASLPLTPETLASADCVVIVTDHTDVDYALVERCGRLIVDTRNAL